jgi:hypothetical protein
VSSAKYNILDLAAFGSAGVISLLEEKKRRTLSSLYG